MAFPAWVTWGRKWAVFSAVFTLIGLSWMEANAQVRPGFGCQICNDTVRCHACTPAERQWCSHARRQGTCSSPSPSALRGGGCCTTVDGLVSIERRRRSRPLPVVGSSPRALGRQTQRPSLPGEGRGRQVRVDGAQLVPRFLSNRSDEPTEFLVSCEFLIGDAPLPPRCAGQRADLSSNYCVVMRRLYDHRYQSQNLSEQAAWPYFRELVGSCSAPVAPSKGFSGEKDSELDDVNDGSGADQ